MHFATTAVKFMDGGYLDLRHALTQNRRRAKSSANAPFNHPAARIPNSLLPHLGHRSNHSPGFNESRPGATVFAQPHAAHL